MIHPSTERANRLRLQGICTQCGQTPARDNRKTCAPCGKKQSLRYRSLGEKGLCARCHVRETIPDRCLCVGCHQKYQTTREYRYRHFLCVRCGRNLESPKYKHCEYCQKYIARANAKRKLK